MHFFHFRPITNGFNSASIWPCELSKITFGLGILFSSPISRWWYLEILTNQKMFLFFSIIKLLPEIFDGTFQNISSLFSFPLRIKTPFRKNITDDSVFFFRMYRKHPNHTYGRNQKRHRVIRLMSLHARQTNKALAFSLGNLFFPYISSTGVVRFLTCLWVLEWYFASGLRLAAFLLDFFFVKLINLEGAICGRIVENNSSTDKQGHL